MEYNIQVHRKKRVTVDDEMFQEIVSLRKMGVSIYNIAYQLGIGTGTVAKRLSKARKNNML